MKKNVVQTFLDIATAVVAGLIVALAYHFFQNSNGFAPGGVGGLATITYHLLDGQVVWAWLMLSYNLPIFILVSIFVDKKFLLNERHKAHDFKVSGGCLSGCKGCGMQKVYKCDVK